MSHLKVVSIESKLENFEQASKDYETALNLKLEHASESHRELAESYFKLGLSFEYSELYEEAIQQVEGAIACIKTRISLLEPESDDKGKEVSEPSTNQVEIDELNGFLTEMEAKVTDLQSLIDKEEEGEQLVNVPVVKNNEVNDISGLVKRKKTEDVGEATKKPKVDE
jgi:HAT1-interacting factor 1